jgi:hypothetical protein
MSAIPADFNWPRFPLHGAADIPFKNTSGTAMTPGQVVKLDTSNPFSPTQVYMGAILTAAVTDVPDGVVVQDTPASTTNNPGFGTMQILGIATVYADAGSSPAAGAILGPSGSVSGAVTTYTAGDPVVGKGLSAGVNASDPILARLILAPLN